MRNFKIRSGFTLVELLVVIAVIAMLVALLLPAVQAAREAGRRAQCMNNLKQLSLGVTNYHSAKEEYPPSGTWPENAKIQDDRQLGPNWVILTLPFLEEQALYDQFNLLQPITGPVNQIARGINVPTMLCPTDTGVDTMYRPSGALTSGFGENWARGNYAANGANAPQTGVMALNSGIFFQGSNSNRYFSWHHPQRRGVMGPSNLRSRAKDITDGASKTLLLAEVRIGLNEHDRRGVWALSGVGSSSLYWHGWSKGSVGPANGPNDPSPSSDDIPGCLDIIKGFGTVHSKNGVAVLAKERMTCRLNRSAANGSQAGARSSHRGGVYGAYVDGSVHFIPNEIETSSLCCSAWDRLILSRDNQVGAPQVD